MSFIFLQKRTKTLQSHWARVLVALYAGVVALGFLGPVWTSYQEISSTQPFVSALEESLPQIDGTTKILVQPPWRQDVVTALQQSGLMPSGALATTAISMSHGQTASDVLILKDPAVPIPSSWVPRLRSPLRKSKSGIEIGFFGTHKEPTKAESIDDLLPQAQVEVVYPDGKTIPCIYRSSNRRHECPGQPDWLNVSLQTQTSGSQTRQCIWTHPISRGHIYIRWESIALTKSLEWTHAIANSGLRAKDGAPVTATLRVNGKSIGHATRDNRPGFAKKRFQLHAPLPKAKLEIDVSTPNDGARHYCWSLTRLPDEAQQ